MNQILSLCNFFFKVEYMHKWTVTMSIINCALPGHAGAGFPPGGQGSVTPDPASGLHWPAVTPPLSPRPERASLPPSH